MIRIYTLFFTFFVAFLTASTPGQQLANYLGTGSNPRLQLQLSANGPNWGGYTIDYQGIGNVPWSTDPSNNWSSWNVYDTDTPANYYGTITLTSDGTSVQWNNYVPGSNGYYLDGINLTYNSGISSYELTVNAIYPSGPGSGPFPDAPPATPAVYPGTSEPIVLQVTGDQIVDNHGNPVWLKGLVRPSLEWSATGQYLSTQDLSNIANWNSGGTTAHSNVIRIDMYQGYWLNSGPVTQIGSYKQIINAIVYYSIQLGMTVILDLHWTQSGYQSPMADADSITFWQQVATDYASFGTVLFELYNEPFGITQDVWLNGDSTYAGYQQLYDAVRGTGAQNICIVGGLDYAYDLSFVNENFHVNGTNIVYCSHPYNAKGQPGYTGEGGTFQQNYQGIIGTYPLIFTEFGTNSASYYPTGYAPIYTNILNYVNANNVHYSGFAWWVQNGDPQFPCLIQDWDGTALYGGVNVHDDIVQNPGTVIDGTANAFLSFETLNEITGTVNFSAVKFGSASYFWDFGDAANQNTPSPLISHSYAKNGTYVVTLTVIKGGIVTYVTSRTIHVTSIPDQNACVLVCPPSHVKGKRVVYKHEGAFNVISWEGPTSEQYCQKPLSYLVFRDASLTDLVAEVTLPNKNGVYRVKDKATGRGNAIYTVVAVDQHGNRSLPISVEVHRKHKTCHSR